MGYYTRDFEGVLASADLARRVTPVDQRCGNDQATSPVAGDMR
jgi:hypothetical protein